MRKILKALRRMPERLLHRWRRRAVTASLGRRPAPESVLVVCHGNICRSPYGEFALRRLLASRGTMVTSAGFVGPDRPSPPEAIEAARARGLDLTSHRSRLLTREMVSTAGLVVVMEAAQGRAIHEQFGRARRDVLVLGDVDPAPIATRNIHDPYDQSLDVFSAVYERMDRCLDSFAAVLAVAPVGAPVSASVGASVGARTQA